MSASYFQPATDFPYDHGQIACRLFLRLACSFWVTFSEDWRFLLAPAAPVLPLILKSWGQGNISFACAAQKDQPPERAPAPCVQSLAHHSPCVQAQAPGSQPAWAALPAGFTHSPALSGWTCHSRSVGFTPCLTSLIYLSLTSAKAQSSGTASPQLTHRQQQGALHGCFVGKDLSSGNPKLKSFCHKLGSSS